MLLYLFLVLHVFFKRVFGTSCDSRLQGRFVLLCPKGSDSKQIMRFEKIRPQFGPCSSLWFSLGSYGRDGVISQQLSVDVNCSINFYVDLNYSNFSAYYLFIPPGQIYGNQKINFQLSATYIG